MSEVQIPLKCLRTGTQTLKLVATENSIVTFEYLEEKKPMLNLTTAIAADITCIVQNSHQYSN